MEIWPNEVCDRGKGTIDCGLRGSVGTLDDMNPTRLSKRSQAVPLQLLGSATTFEEHEGLEDFLLFVVKLLQSQADIERAEVQKCMAIVTFFTEAQRAGELRTYLFHCQSKGQRHQRRWYKQRRCVWYGWRKGISYQLYKLLQLRGQGCECSVDVVFGDVLPLCQLMEMVLQVP